MGVPYTPYEANMTYFRSSDEDTFIRDLFKSDELKIDEESMMIGYWRPEVRSRRLFYAVLGANGYFQGSCKPASQGHGEG